MAGYGRLSSERSVLKFHHKHGTNVKLGEDGRRATRDKTHENDGLVFSSRRIAINEPVLIRLLDFTDEKCFGLGLGVTNIPPDSHELPESLPSSIVDEQRSGYWVARMSELNVSEGDRVEFFVARNGDFIYRIEKQETVVTPFSGLDTTFPLWMVLDMHGYPRTVELVPRVTHHTQRVRQQSFRQTASSISPRSVSSSVRIRPNSTFGDDQFPFTPSLSNSTLSNALNVSDFSRQMSLSSSNRCPMASASNQEYFASSVESRSDLAFYPTHGLNIRLEDDRRPAVCTNDSFDRIAISDRPIGVMEKVRLRLIGVPSADALGVNLALTIIPPESFNSSRELPRSSGQCTEGFCWLPLSGHYAAAGSLLELYFSENGTVRFSIDGENKEVFPSLVDTHYAMWAVVDAYGQPGSALAFESVSGAPPEPQFPFLESLSISDQTGNVSPSADSTQMAEPSTMMTSSTMDPATSAESGDNQNQTLSSTTRDACKICVKAEVNTAVTACGHTSMCYECAVKWKQSPDMGCPICGQPDKNFIRIYRV